MKIYYSISDFVNDNKNNKEFNTSVALGYFDGVHIGHKHVIQKVIDAKKNTGDDRIIPTVFTFSCDGFCNKGDNILTQKQRFKVLEQMGVEIVIAPKFSEIKDINPDDFVIGILKNTFKASVLSCGFNYHFGAKGIGDTKLLKSMCESENITLYVEDKNCELSDVISSTRIKKYLLSGDIKQANKLLGYNYFITGEVVKGYQLGRTLGFPTINQNLETGIVVPRYGIYHTDTIVDGKRYKSVTNVGVKPTISGDRLPLVETFIIDLSKDLYGQEIMVEFVDFIRPEQKFENLDELIKAIQNDVKVRG